MLKTNSAHATRAGDKAIWNLIGTLILDNDLNQIAIKYCAIISVLIRIYSCRTDKGAVFVSFHHNGYTGNGKCIPILILRAFIGFADPKDYSWKSHSLRVDKSELYRSVCLNDKTNSSLARRRLEENKRLHRTA